MASAKLNFSIAFKPTPTIRTRSSRTWRISGRRNLSPFRGAVRAYRSGRRHPVQSQTERRLPDGPGQLPRKQWCRGSSRKAVAPRSNGFATRRPRRANGTISRSASQARRSRPISTASFILSTRCRNPYPAGSACGRGRQPHVFQRFCGDAGQLTQHANLPSPPGSLMDAPLLELAVYLTATFAAALVAGVAGFAFGLIAAAAWLHILTPLQTTTLIILNP